MIHRFTAGLVAALAVACNTSLPPEQPDTFALDCPGVTAHAAGVETFLVVGHRGAAAKEVENTIPAMARAVADGANAVEIDLAMTRDGVIVLFHDWDPNSEIALAREAGAEASSLARPSFPAVGSDLRRPVDELSLAEVREHFGYVRDGERAPVEIPTLDAFLAWAGGRPELAYVLFDLKVPEAKSGLAAAMVRQIESSLAATQSKFRHVFLTPYDSVYQAASAALGEGPALSFDVDPGLVVVDEGGCDESSSARAVARGSGHATTVKPLGWSASAWGKLKRLVTCDLERRDRAGANARVPEKVFAATINERDKMECLVDMGVDGVLTDDPALLREVVIQRRRR